MANPANQVKEALTSVLAAMNDVEQSAEKISKVLPQVSEALATRVNDAVETGQQAKEIGAKIPLTTGIVNDSVYAQQLSSSLQTETQKYVDDSQKIFQTLTTVNGELPPLRAPLLAKAAESLNELSQLNSEFTQKLVDLDHKVAITQGKSPSSVSATAYQKATDNVLGPFYQKSAELKAALQKENQAILKGQEAIATPHPRSFRR
jgi:hypothetical protein